MEGCAPSRALVHAGSEGCRVPNAAVRFSADTVPDARVQREGAGFKDSTGGLRSVDHPVLHRLSPPALGAVRDSLDEGVSSLRTF